MHIAWLLLAYLVLPVFWRHYEHQPAVQTAPKTTLTPQGIPGDPLNVGLIATEQEVVRAVLGADLANSGWVTEEFQVTGVGATLLGRNGGGDRYYTDGELTIGLLAREPSQALSPSRLKNPAPVPIKNPLWSAIRPLMNSLAGQ